jgi:hypothetical protein
MIARVALLLAVTAPLVAADEPADVVDIKVDDAPRWDDEVLGLTLKQPQRGSYWLVSDTLAGTPAAGIFQPEDQLMAVDGTRIRKTQEILPALMKSGPVEIKYSRTITEEGKRPKRIIETVTLSKPTQWDLLLDKFTVHGDADINDDKERTLMVKWPAKGTGHDVVCDPRLVFEKDLPLHYYIDFTYVGDRWLFIEKVTFKHGDETFTTKPTLDKVLREVTSSSQVLEEFLVFGDPADRIVRTVIADPTADGFIRFHGRSHYADHSLTLHERQAFMLCEQLRTFAIQRNKDLSKD